MGSRPFNPMYPVYDFNNYQNIATASAFTSQGSHAFGFGSSLSMAEPLPAGTPGSISESAIIQKY